MVKMIAIKVIATKAKNDETIKIDVNEAIISAGEMVHCTINCTMLLIIISTSLVDLDISSPILY